MRSRSAESSERDASRQRRAVAVLVLLLIAFLSVWAAGCDSEETGEDPGTSTTEEGDIQSGDVEGRVGEVISAADVRITVKALEATFQPSQPVQRISEEIPAAPEAGEAFYQAYVRVENRGASPVRVDAEDFACLVGDTVVGIEPTRSGPLPRSLLKNTSLDLILTFKSVDGFEPVLLYNPPWYQGTIQVTPGTDTTTEPT